MDDEGYIDLGDDSFPTDPSEIVQDSFSHLQAKFPGWQPREGNLETVVLEENAQEAAVARQLAQKMAEAAFRRMGVLVSVPPIDPSPAQATSTWTLSDADGHTIPAGTQITLTALDGQPIGFYVVADVVVPNGSTVTAAGEVELIAFVDGSRGSGLAGSAELIDALAWVDDIAIVGVTTGGVDGESTAAYIDRLARRLRLMSARVIRPEDAEAIVLDIAGIAHSWAIDNYNAVTEETDVERCLTVAVADVAGEPLSVGIKGEADDLLKAQRETTFLTFVIDATYTVVDVAYEVTAAAGFETAAVEAATEAALQAYLSPATSILRQQDSVYINELVSLLDQVPGVDRVLSVEIAATGGALAAVDLVLTGVAPLTRPGVLTPTVTA